MKIGFGGGCHWCTEGVFQSIKGVTHVDQGWIQSDGTDDWFSEAVIVTFDHNEISQETLIEIHLLTHSSQADHSMRSKYRSAIYFFDEAQEEEIKNALLALQEQAKGKYITKVIPMVRFRRNKERFLNYYQKNPKAPFCQTYISPKLEKLRRTHKGLIAD